MKEIYDFSKRDVTCSRKQEAVQKRSFPQHVLGVFSGYPEVIEAGIPYVRTGAFAFLLVPVTQAFTVALRSAQQTHLPLIASVTGLCTNTLLDCCLIYGHFGLPRMGIQGAAFARISITAGAAEIRGLPWPQK